MIKNLLIVFLVGAVAVLGFQSYQQKKLVKEYADLKIKHEKLLAANLEKTENGLDASRKNKEDLIKQLKQILGAQLGKQKPKEPPAAGRIRSVAKESSRTKK